MFYFKNKFFALKTNYFLYNFRFYNKKFVFKSKNLNFKADKYLTNQILYYKNKNYIENSFL